MSAHQPSLFGFEPDPEPWEVDDSADRAVASVVLSEPPFGPFDYLIPDGLRGHVLPGCRVQVPLGRGSRRLVGYCVEIGNEQASSAGAKRTLKPLSELLDPQPLLSPLMLRLTRWMADYYFCPWGQVLEAVIPAGVRTQAGTRTLSYLSVPTEVAAKLTKLDLPTTQAALLRALAASPRPLTASELAARVGCTQGPIRELRKKGLVEVQVVRAHRGDLELQPAAPIAPPELNAEQQRAVDTVVAALRASRQETILLHGVTGSGKTEVYMRSIEEVISYGRQAIVLVPEISLTPQTVARFRARFPRVAVLHSHQTGSERHWHWQQIARGEVQVVVGARSAIFAPTRFLGLIVLDEEHDSSFKQDSAPRYHAREVALQRAQQESVPVILGSATPCLETWSAAQAGSYRWVELSHRVLERPLPDVAVIDLRTEYRNRSSRGAISRPLYQAIKQALAGGGQVILLLNRRGFATSIQCPACGEVLNCSQCEIALTHHREGDRAVCHYCDYEVVTPKLCAKCNFEGVRFSGLGTQRLEAEVRQRFPQATCLRMDSDTMRRPGSHEEAFEKFRAGEVQILLGTQMIAKGLDFPNVTLVGVINADTALHFPDFRAAERTFQLVTQVAGRTGRGVKGGRVFVQTFSPEHPAIQAAMGHDYQTFATRELLDRQEHGYPPITKMTRIIVRGPDEKMTEAFADQLGERLRGAVEKTSPDTRILGPAPAPLAKLQGRFRFHLLMIGPSSQPLTAAIQTATQNWETTDEIQWAVDVDPINML